MNDLLFVNGHVLTSEPGRRETTWVHVVAGRIGALGDGAPPDVACPRFDLGGRTLAPAFCDAHVHLTWLATAFLGCDLAGADGVPAVLETLAAWRGPGRGPGGAWVVGHGFDETAWHPSRLPTRAELDRVVPKRPVLVQRVCGHVGVLNGAALGLVEPGPFTDPVTGRIAEDDLYAVNDRLRPSAADLAAALPDVVAMLHAHGITAVHDVTPPEMLRALVDTPLGLGVSCAIPVRYLAAPGAPAACRDAAAYFAAQGLAEVPVDRSARVRVLGLKLFTDGSLGARTAFLRSPYADAPATRGAPLYAAADLARLAASAHRAGLQLMVHAIGDAAVDLALDALAPLAAAGNPERHRLEHVEVTPPDLVLRLAASGLRVCAQPNFAGRWSQPGGMNGARLGPRRDHCNAYRTLQQAGVRLAFGSDCMPLGPLFGLRSAVLHPVPAERLEGGAALALYTAAPAELAFAENRHGRIAPGLDADLVVLSQDPGTMASADWAHLRVEATFRAGRLVHGGGPVAAPGCEC